MPRWFEYTQALQDAGVMRAGEALHGADTATTVRVRDGERLASDGPFAETKEVLGGYYVIDVADLDAALAWAERCRTSATARSRCGRSWCSTTCRPRRPSRAPRRDACAAPA